MEAAKSKDHVKTYITRRASKMEFQLELFGSATGVGVSASASQGFVTQFKVQLAKFLPSIRFPVNLSKKLHTGT